VRRLVDDLQTDPAALRGRTSSTTCWPSPSCGLGGRRLSDVKAGLRAQADDPGSELRRRLAATLVALGGGYGRPALAERVEAAVETGVRYVAEQFSDEIAVMVSGTIARWDGREIDRLELLDRPAVHPHNGTVVGGPAASPSTVSPRF
jgi:uncharacterized membrane-anchored protein YjiN (DUF445 family)